MIRISALNDSSSSEDEAAYTQVTQTKEAKEAEAFVAYNKALSYQQSGNWEYAEKLLRNLFEHPFLKEAASLVESDDDDTPSSSSPVHPGLQLLYLVHKNLASILLQRKDLKEAMASYIEAVKIDSSEVTVWFKMGQIALKIHNYPLAKICFQQALQCNPNHWPSLDISITVTFALGDYLMCLEHISSALERDCHYTKGLALKKKIFLEQPSLESITKDLFLYCDPQIHTIAVDEEDSKEYLDECNKMRAKQRELYEEDNEKEYKPMTFLKPLAPFTWKNVGECLLELYQFATTSDPPKSLGLEVDLRDYNFLDQSIIFGKDAVEEEGNSQKKNPIRGTLKPCVKAGSQLKEKIDGGEYPSQGSPFQRAMERGNAEPPTTPESLSVGDNAKECALLQRLQGCEKKVDQRDGSSGSSKKVNSGADRVHPSSNPLADLEDMDVDNDFSEMPSLEEAMDISNLNLKDIQKFDFAPDLFLKASEDDLGLGNEVKSLESVLSNVIDMEFNRTKTNLGDSNIKTPCHDPKDPIPGMVASELPKSSNDKCEKDQQEQNKVALINDQSMLEQTHTPQSFTSSSHQGTSPSHLGTKLITSSGSFAENVKQPSSQTASLMQTCSSVAPSVYSPTVISTPKVPQIDAIKSSETTNYNLDTGQDRSNAPHSSSPFPSHFSPKINAMESNTSSANQSMLSCISGRSDDENGSTLYLTPMAPQTKHEKLSSLNTQSEQKNQNPSLSSPSSEVPRKKVPSEKKHVQPSISSVPIKPVPRRGKLTCLSTGDLIEDVVRRQIMGPPLSEESSQRHATSLFPNPALQSSPLASASILSQPMHFSSPSKTPPRHSPGQFFSIPPVIHSLEDEKISPQPHSSHEAFSKSGGLTCLPKAHTSREVKMSSVHSYPQGVNPSQNLQRSVRSLSFSASLGCSTSQGNQFLRHSMSVDAPTYLPIEGEEISRERFSGSVCLPRHHLYTLSVLETEALLNASPIPLSRDQASLLVRGGPSPWRPPLARSSSMPGYLTSPLTHPSQILPNYPEGSSLVSHVTANPGDNYRSLLDFYPTVSGHDLPGLSPSMSGNATQKPKSLFVGSPLSSLPNPFSISAMSSSLVSPAFSLTKQAHSGERKSPVHSPSSPTILVQQSRKSPKVTSPVKHQQRYSPSHQPLAGAPTSPKGCGKTSTQGNLSYHERAELYQAMVKSMLESDSQTQQKVQSPSRASPAKDNKSHTALGTDHKSSAKRGPKRKSELSSLGEDWTQAYKRRSTRSRSSRSKKEVESPDFGKLMKQYFPRSLAVLEDENCTDATVVDLTQKTTNKDCEGQQESRVNSDRVSTAPALEETEEDDVKRYVKSCLKGHGLLQLIHVYLVRLGEKSCHLWYPGLSDIYVKLYHCLRKHLTIPTIWFGDNDDCSPSRLRDYAIILLIKAELSLSKVVSEHSALGSPSPSKKASSLGPNMTDLFGEFHEMDMSFLEALAGRDDVFNQEDLTLTQFSARLFWLQARQHQAVWQTLEAVDCFQMVQSILEDTKDKDGETNLVIILPNVGPDGVISLQEVSQMMESVQRCQSLEDTRDLYDRGEFSKVVENLMASFNEKNISAKSAASKERPSQLLLLLDSLLNLKRFTEVLRCGEICLNEAILHFQRAPSVQLRQDWAATLISLFETLDRVLDEEDGILKSLNHQRLIRLAHNLVTVIQIVLDVADSVTEMPIATVRPWKILYRVLRFEEESVTKGTQGLKRESWEERMDTDQGEEEEAIRPSLAMLIKSHVYLGRHSWCTKDEGLLLIFMISVLGKELSVQDDEEDDDDEYISSAFEQCVFCLYNHPNKRGRARHLSDHNAAPVEMSWDGAGPVFHYFAPHTIPEFDSYKTSAISSDVEHLLRKIFTLIPASLQPDEKHTAVVDYIEGTSTVLPTKPTPSPAAPYSPSLSDPYQICSSLYYLLGDFYFKNKEQTKAVKFYQLDVAVNSDRLDSWAGLALARMSQLTQKLNSTELKVEIPLYKKSEAALRCFRRAVELEDASRKLWLEFGSLAYQLHSHASRQIRYRNMFNISGEMLLASRSRRTEMLRVARNSYHRANECEGDCPEDDWLTHYMMGKVAEKQGESPKVFLEFYNKAALSLHEEEAEYPAKLQFNTLPPHLALEALEVFFRIHATSLKLLLAGCSPQCLLILDSFVTDAQKGYFARREEKHQQASQPVKHETPLAPSATKTAQSNKKPKKTYTKNPMDHDYARYKSMSDSQSEGEERKQKEQITPGHLEDIEGNSDWSQEEVIVPDKSAAEMISPEQTTSLDVFEISSPHESKAVTTSSNTEKTQNLPDTCEDKNSSHERKSAASSFLNTVETSVLSSQAKDQHSTQEKEALNSDLTINRNSETAVGWEQEELKDKSSAWKSNSLSEANEACLEPEAGQVVKGMDAELESEVINVEPYSAEQSVAMKTDTVKESLSMKQSHDNHSNLADIDLSVRDLEEKKTDSEDNLEKSVVVRSESFGFQVTENDRKEVVKLEDSAANEIKEDGHRPTEQPHESDMKDGHADVPMDVETSECKRTVTEENENNLAQETCGSSGLTSHNDTEKWELEDQEKSFANRFSETNSVEEPVSGSSLAAATEEMMQDVREENTASSCADIEKLRSDVKQKCMAGLELCASRFSSHYKSLYRLAHAYYIMKEYGKARDLLLGCPDWQQKSHMPAPGLFSDRKQNNFFQGLWKIPIEDLERSGSFASHVHRSVQLLLNVLADQGDLDMLLLIRNQLKRTPDSGKKYLRDSERLILADAAYLKCLTSLKQSMERSESWSEARREDNLLTVFRVWNLGKGGNHGLTATSMLHTAFKLMMKGRTDVNRLTPEQAVMYCNQNLSKLLTPVANNQGQSSQKSLMEKNKQGQGTLPPILTVEKQDSAKENHKDCKDEDMIRKDDMTADKVGVTREPERDKSQSSSAVMSKPVLSPPQLSALDSSTSASAINAPESPLPSDAKVIPPSIASSNVQENEDVIFISAPERMNVS
ncbi:hypothetical protein RRG08_056311 [Elysia crispata]|uniref:Calcineurin-binding protein cabin-1 n=1 Tax=Elysia crispata TaxID=231223 RepID=A0AAE0YPU1_9GAST|nr:hypothetical protein RRG08_056311 [Elysia crispata]